MNIDAFSAAVGSIVACMLIKAVALYSYLRSYERLERKVRDIDEAIARLERMTLGTGR
jgi:hypothetical protein